MYTTLTYHYTKENALSKLYNDKVEAAFRRYLNKEESEKDLETINSYRAKKLTAAQATAVEDLMDLRYAVVKR